MKITMKRLRPVLLRLQTVIENEITDLNCGGCGVFAYQVGKHLERLGIRAEVITPTRAMANSVAPSLIVPLLSKRKAKDCRNWDALGLERLHLAIRFKLGLFTYTYDSEALLQSKTKFGYDGQFACGYKFGNGLTIAQTGTLARDDKWNQTFDRAQIKRVKILIKQAFAELYE